MNIFQVYKIILGLIVAGFVVFFVANFLGDYVGLNTQTNTYKAMNNFRNVVQDVYNTGNSVEFNQFSQKTMPEIYIQPSESFQPMGIKSGSISMSFFTPIIFMKEKGQGFVLERNEIDLGWTKFYMVYAVSDLVVIFSPENTASLDLIKKITSSFQSNEKVLFTTCSFGSIQSPKKQNEFLDLLNLGSISTGTCIADKPAYVHRIVEIKNNCFGSDGVCVQTSSTNIGKIFVNGNEHVYRDVFDIVAVIIGGAEIDVFGGTLGEKLLREKNNFFKNQLLIQTVLEKNTIEIIDRNNNDCLVFETRFKSDLERLETYLDKSIDDFITEHNSNELVMSLENAAVNYKALKNGGCL